MRRLAVLCLLCTASVCFADTTYLGLYLKGSKIGYSSFEESTTQLDGKTVKRTDSKTQLDAGLLGSTMSVSLTSTAWLTLTGQPIRMNFDTESGGRSNRVRAQFSKTSVELQINNGGVETRRTLLKPIDGAVVDDPIALVLRGGVQVGTTRTFYVLDPSTASFMKNSVLFLGSATTQINNRTQTARLIRVTDPTTVTDVYVNSAGKVIKVNGAMGMVMLPVSKAIALSKPTHYSQATDLALTTSLKADKVVNDPEELAELKLKMTSDSIRNIPSDSFQTITRAGKSWIVDIHPPKLTAHPGRTIDQAKLTKPEWLSPSLNIPSDSPKFRKLAADVIGNERDVQNAAFLIQMYVYQHMNFNAGIGVLRDASEVLETKEGVCRDFAVLTVTLLRAANIPARLASGLVNSDGAFYYHAWAEAWDGERWIGVDSVTDRAQISASHVKLGEGNIDTAFTFSFLEKAKIEVLQARKD